MYPLKDNVKLLRKISVELKRLQFTAYMYRHICIHTYAYIIKMCRHACIHTYMSSSKSTMFLTRKSFEPMKQYFNWILQKNIKEYKNKS